MQTKSTTWTGCVVANLSDHENVPRKVTRINERIADEVDSIEPQLTADRRLLRMAPKLNS